MKLFSALVLLLPLAVAAAEPVTLNWLGGAAPTSPDGVSWGVPWPKGAVQANTRMRLATADGKRVEVQTWPVAYWPDGSIKWTGHSIAATAGLAGPLQLTPFAGAEEERTRSAEIKYTDDATGITIDTGALRARIAKKGASLIESLVVGDRTVAQDGKLILQLEDRSRSATERVLE